MEVAASYAIRKKLPYSHYLEEKYIDKIPGTIDESFLLAYSMNFGAGRKKRSRMKRFLSSGLSFTTYNIMREIAQNRPIDYGKGIGNFLGGGALTLLLRAYVLPSNDRKAFMYSFAAIYGFFTAWESAGWKVVGFREMGPP